MDSVLLLSPLATWAVLQATSPAIRILVDFDVMSDLLVFGIVWLIALWTVMTIGLGVWGLTPGKWLFGVRVVRSTLRPCGIPRAALRELLIWLDAPQLLVVAPGAICLLLTQNRQRVGDLAADTLVVDC